MNNAEAQKMLKQIRILLPRLSSLGGSAPEFRESVFNYRASQIPSKLEKKDHVGQWPFGSQRDRPGTQAI